MSFATNVLSKSRPSRLAEIVYPRRQAYFPSPVDWRGEVLYFLLVDRFSDGQEGTRPLLDRRSLAAARPAAPGGSGWSWQSWAQSGSDHWQGGTLKGVASKLGYLKDLGVTALWLSPVFMQRGHLDTYHGYGIQDFLEVDPHFGDRRDLVALVAAAHQAGLRIILDIIFNHSGENWIYPGGVEKPAYTTGRYDFGAWLGAQGQTIPLIQGRDDGAWPGEFQDVDCYTRAGTGSLDAGAIESDKAEHKRTDFETLRDFRLERPDVLNDLAACYKYWIALTDCDGFRIDTLKHVSYEQARNFCGSIKEFATNLGKSDFFLVGEIAGGDTVEASYLQALTRNLNAALDIGEMRLALGPVAKGLAPAGRYFDGFRTGEGGAMASHRCLGEQHVSVLDDHDHVWGEKIRFSGEAASEHQVAAGVALQLLTLGIPCVYYGTEQALGGPEPAERQWLPQWKGHDRYLREALFGPRHPRRQGRAGLPGAASPVDSDLPGFGPFGTAGRHCFDPGHPAYRRIAALAALRREYYTLRYGRQYLRPIRNFGAPFGAAPAGEVVAWSRVLDDEELLCVLNAHGTAMRGADIIVDAELNAGDPAHPNKATMTVVFNSAQAAAGSAFAGPHPVDTTLTVRRAADGAAFVEIRDLPASETLVLANHPAPEEGRLRA